MAKDIITRLRSLHAYVKVIGEPNEAALIKEAIAEIQRLRKELAAAQKEVPHG